MTYTYAALHNIISVYIVYKVWQYNFINNTEDYMKRYTLELIEAAKDALDTLEQLTGGIERHNEADEWENPVVTRLRNAIDKAAA